MWLVQDTWTKFVYPFVLHSRDEHAFLEFAGQIATFGLGGKTFDSTHPMWQECLFTDGDLENMIPYVKRYMRLDQNQRRFTVAKELLFMLDNMQTDRMREDDPGFCVSDIDLHLFFNGIGILVIEIQPSPHWQGSIEVDWIEDLNADLANVMRGRVMWQRQARGAMVEEAQEDLLEPLKSMAQGHPISMLDFIQRVLLASLLDGSGVPQWHAMADTFLLVYGALLLTPHQDFSDGELDARFKEFSAQHMSVLRKCLTSNNTNRFAQEIFGDPEHNYMPYHNVIHTQSLEGGYVLAYNNRSSHFYGKNSPAMKSFRTNYFYMMLLPIHQRMSILTYGMEAADAALVTDRAVLLRALRGRIYDFSSRCYFSQASVSEERHQLYRRWQRAFNVSQMYGELKEEIHEIDDYLAEVAREQKLSARQRDLRQEAERTRLFSYVSFILLPMSILIELIQASPIIIKWFDFHDQLLRSVITLGVLFVAGTLLSGALLRIFLRLHD